MPEAHSWGVRAIRIEGEWRRGTVRTLEGDDGDDWLEWLDDDPAEEIYDWAVAPKLPYDLAAIRHPVDVLGFVRHWGLLHADDDDDAALPTVREFMRESLTMNWLLYLYGLLRPAGDPSATRRSLAEYMVNAFTTGTVTREWLTDPRRRGTSAALIEHYATNANTESMRQDLREILDEEIHDRLQTDVQLSITNTDGFELDRPNESPPPGDFVLSIYPRDLLARTYAELAMIVTAGMPVATCPEDSRPFAVHDPRQIYCSKQCAGRARYHRFATRKRSSN